MSQGKKNAYRCAGCGHEIVTVDRDDGTTPFSMDCIACGGGAFSAFYNIDQDRVASHEWYIPGAEERAELLRLYPQTITAHVDEGGLLCRSIGGDVSLTTQTLRRMAAAGTLPA